MSSEFDLSADLAAIQARLNGAFDGIHEILAPSQCAMPATDVEQHLKEQTHQMKEMASMMKIIMSLAMPLLEAETKRKAVEEEIKRNQEDELINSEKRQKQIIWTKRGAFCHKWGCGGRISEHRPNSNQVLCCLCAKLYNLSEQKPETDLEMAYMVAFLDRSNINAEAAAKESQQYKLQKEKKEEERYKQKEEKWQQKMQFEAWIEKEKEKKLKKIEKMKTEWSCPNDGCAHEWKNAGKLYARTFEGDIWEWAGEELGKWVGKWDQQRKEIDTTAPEPEFEDESTTEEVRKAEESQKQKREKEHQIREAAEKARQMRLAEEKEREQKWEMNRKMQAAKVEEERKQKTKIEEKWVRFVSEHGFLSANGAGRTAEAIKLEEIKKERNAKPLGSALGDFYQEKSQTWWRCPADDKLHVFRWEKRGSELLVNWKGEAWVCRRAGAGFGEIQYEFANEGNWIGIYVRGEDRWDSMGPSRSANIPPPSGPSYPNGFPGDSVPPPIYRPINFPRGSW